VIAILSETIVAPVRAEMRRHEFDACVDEPPSIAKGAEESWFQAVLSARCD